jgi:diadenosine tetraphosphate (Ap4A) HIT family hydrolase
VRVRIERRGGVAGRPAVGEREDHELTAAEQAALKELLAKPPPPQAMAMGADRFHYKVTIEDEKGTNVLDVPEHLMPQALAAIPKIDL